MPEQVLSNRGIAFRLFGFPILYRWSALLLPVYFTFTVYASVRLPPARLLELFVAVTVGVGAAILIHELGHAATARAFGGEARIEFVLLGGLTHHSYTRELTNGQKILVSSAGSIAGLLAALPVFVVFSQDVLVGLRLSLGLWQVGINVFVLAAGVWGLLNLLPLPGLDGSHILEALLRMWVPSRAATIFPIVTTITALAAIVGVYLWNGIFGALWLTLIFGPELARFGERMRAAKDQPLIDDAVVAVGALHGGDLEKALALSTTVLDAATSDRLRAVMVDVRRTALSRLGRADELIAFDDSLPAELRLPSLARAKAQMARGRLAQAESELRSSEPGAEGESLLAEVLIRQDLDHRVGEVLGPASAPILAQRAAELERLEPEISRRMARAILDSANSPAISRAQAHMTLGEAPDLTGFAGTGGWAVAIEQAARAGDGVAFESGLRSIPDQGLARLVQRRLHVIGRWDQASALGSVLEPDPAARFVLARSLALLGRRDEAMRALEAAVSAGWRDAPEAVTSPDLVSLHSHPRWGALLASMAGDPS